MTFEDEIRYTLSSSGESWWITDSACRLAKTCFGAFFSWMRCRKRRRTEFAVNLEAKRVNDSGREGLVA
jgi:hypothetical protein